MCWTEDNRMQAYVQMNEGTDKGRAAYYGYNTTGERYVRYIGTTINITQNGITFHRPILQSPVLYANSLITLNGKGYTKHYFEGEYEELFEQQYTGIKETFANCIGTDMEDICEPIEQRKHFRATEFRLNGGKNSLPLSFFENHLPAKHKKQMAKEKTLSPFQ